MKSLWILIPLSLILVTIAVGFLLRAIFSGQYEDLERYERQLPDDD